LVAVKGPGKRVEARFAWPIVQKVWLKEKHFDGRKESVRLDFREWQIGYRGAATNICYEPQD